MRGIIPLCLTRKVCSYVFAVSRYLRHAYSEQQKKKEQLQRLWYDPNLLKVLSQVQNFEERKKSSNLLSKNSIGEGNGLCEMGPDIKTLEEIKKI